MTSAIGTPTTTRTSTPIKRQLVEGLDILDEWKRHDHAKLIDLFAVFVANIVDFNCLEELENVLEDTLKLSKEVKEPTSVRLKDSIVKKLKFSSFSKDRSVESSFKFGSSENISGLYKLIEFLSTDKCINTRGVFRVAGTSEVNWLRLDLASGKAFNWEDSNYTAHDAATLLKQLLSEMPNRIIPQTLSPIYSKACDFKRTDDLHFELKKQADCKRVKLFSGLIMLFPGENKELFLKLLKLLHKIAANEENSLMSAYNLGLMLSPCIFEVNETNPSKGDTMDVATERADGYFMRARLLTLLIEQNSEIETPPVEVLESVLDSTYGNSSIPPDFSLETSTISGRRFPFMKRKPNKLEQCGESQSSIQLSLQYVDTTLSPQVVDKDVLKAKLCAQFSEMVDGKTKKRLAKRFQNNNVMEVLKNSPAIPKF